MGSNLLITKEEKRALTQDQALKNSLFYQQLTNRRWILEKAVKYGVHSEHGVGKAAKRRIPTQAAFIPQSQPDRLKRR
jgi:hypothetical protein